MKITTVSIKEVKLNKDNPRTIKDDKFKKLVKSIKEFPQMLDIRPIVVNKDMVVLGGNMRLKACKEAGLTEIPIIQADSLTPMQQEEFIVKDNIAYGEWEWTELGDLYGADELEEWGLDVLGLEWEDEPSGDDLLAEDKNEKPVAKITFVSAEQLNFAEPLLQRFIEDNFKGAYFSVRAGEL